MTVRIDEKGTIWVGAGAVVLYGPFTDDERDSIRRRILVALGGVEDEPVAEVGSAVSWYCLPKTNWHSMCASTEASSACECECHD
jgi:hypothetical protein